MFAGLGVGIGSIRKAFSPLDNSALALWLDGIDTTSMTRDGSNKLSLWMDKSGLGNHVTQGTTLQQPTWLESSDINGRPAVTFDGSATNMAGASNSAFNFMHNGGGGSLYVVTRQNLIDPGTQHAIVGTGGPSNTIGFYLSYNNVIPNNRVLFAGGNGTATSMTTSNNNVFTPQTNLIFSCFNSSASSPDILVKAGNVLVSNTNYPNAVSTSDATNVLRLGKNPNNANNLYYNGSIGEILIFNRVLNAAEDTQVYRYLSNRWGI